MTHKINTDAKVAVSTEICWLPIDKNTPRNCKVLAINKDGAGICQQSFIKPDEQWFTHWLPLPKFKNGERE